MLHHDAMYSEEINIADILFTGSDLGMEAHLEVEACQMYQVPFQTGGSSRNGQSHGLQKLSNLVSYKIVDIIAVICRYNV